jgi:hypothetical protein
MYIEVHAYRKRRKRLKANAAVRDYEQALYFDTVNMAYKRLKNLKTFYIIARYDKFLRFCLQSFGPHISILPRANIPAKQERRCKAAFLRRAGIHHIAKRWIPAPFLCR